MTKNLRKKLIKMMDYKMLEEEELFDVYSYTDLMKEFEDK